MMKNGKVILHVSQLQAINKFEQFIEGSEYLIAHGSIVFETISQDFYKFVMCEDYRSMKCRMKTIIEKFGSKETWAFYTTGAHGALTDARALANICTSHKLSDWFLDWKSFGQLAPITLKKPQVNFLPG